MATSLYPWMLCLLVTLLVLLNRDPDPIPVPVKDLKNLDSVSDNPIWVENQCCLIFMNETPDLTVLILRK